MPLFIDMHELADATPEDVREAHLRDVDIQHRHGVQYLKYWFNRSSGRAFCLVEAPNPEAAAAVHREAHGLEAGKIVQVDPDMVDAFLGGGDQANYGAALSPESTPPELDGGFRVILFTDIVGSTALTQRLGDHAAMRLLRAHNDLVREALDVWKGREVKHTGDGIMASFRSASNGVGCAIDVQRSLHRHNGEAQHPIHVRVGLSAGEPVEEAGDLFGAAVQLAARVCAEAGGGQILVANVVAELCVGKPIAFADRGEAALKGFERPVRIHEVRWQA